MYMMLANVAFFICALLGLAALAVLAIWAWLTVLDRYARAKDLRKQWAYFCRAVQRLGLEQAEAVSKREIELERELREHDAHHLEIRAEMREKYSKVITRLREIADEDSTMPVQAAMATRILNELGESSL